MNVSQMSALRFFNQHINGQRIHSPKELVQWLGAIQAQDYNMAKWALGVRLKGSTNETIEDAINRGEILRTHVLRPTWHFTAPEDLRWMMELSAAGINRLMGTNNRKLELDDKTFKKSNAVIEKMLRDGRHLTRKEIMSALEKKGIQTNDIRAAHIMLRAETDMIACSGPRSDKQFTYALFDEKVPPRKLGKEEALTLLATKYFRSRGPATLQDFSWWSGLSVADSKTGMENIRREMLNEEIKGHTFWYYSAPAIKRHNKIVFLPAYDEFLISYKTREVSLPAEFSSKTFTTNGIFNPTIVHKGKVVGLWKAKNIKGLSVQRNFFCKPSAIQNRLCINAANEFARFMGIRKISIK